MGSVIDNGFQSTAYAPNAEGSLGSSGIASAGKEQVARIGSATKEKALSQVDSRKSMLVDQLKGVISSLESLSKDGQSPIPAPLIGKATGFLRQTADSIESRSTQELLEQAQSGMRQRPGAWLAGCLAVGFLAGRLLRT